MGCGIGKLKREHEEQITSLKQAHSQEVTTLRAELEETHHAEMQRLESERLAALNEKESEWSKKWRDVVTKVLAADRAQSKAEEDARLMRHKAIDRDELVDEVAKLTKQKRRLEARVVDLQEEMRLQKLIYEGQKDILKKQKRETEEEANDEKRRLSATYDEERMALLEKQEQLENDKEKVSILLRVQTENALALQAGKPNGTSF